MRRIPVIAASSLRRVICEVGQSTTYLDHNEMKQRTAYPYPLSAQHAVQAIVQLKLEMNIEAAVLLSCLWGSTQRPKCVESVLVENVRKRGENALDILLVEGKGVQMRHRPFVAHTYLGQFASMTDRWLRMRKGKEYMFTQIHSHRQRIRNDIRDTLKKLDARYELRSIRRGALEQLATTLLPRDLMAYSGHATEGMVQRYLRWGMAAGAEAEQLLEASTVLYNQ
jgi:hypothetical protein